MSLILLDPNLSHPHGHHMEWDLAIAAASLSREQNVIIFAHVDCTLASMDGIEVIPWFSHSCYEEESKDPITGRFEDFRYFNDKLAEELELLPRDRFRATDAVLVPTLTERNLLGYVSWMKTFEQAHAPLFVLHLMFPSGLGAPDTTGKLPVADPMQALFYKLAFQRAAEPGPALHFFGGGRQLAREFSELLGYDIDPHPIPNRPVRVKRGVGKGARSSALLFAGDAKADKGFLLVPPLAERLGTLYPDWDFLIHANAGAAWGEALAAYRDLLEIADARFNISVRTGRLSREDYLGLMEEADCFVCTYDPFVYARKSSGVVWEAISLGMPVLAPAGTWLDQEPREWGAGHGSYSIWSVDGIVEEFGRFAGSLEEKYQQSAAAAERYHAFNGADALINQIGRMWVPRMMAASLTIQPAIKALPLDKMIGTGWYNPETVNGGIVRWVGKEFEIEFDWPFSSAWQVEIVANHFIGKDQVTSARAFCAGKPLALEAELNASRGGQIVATGPGPGRDTPRVKLQVVLPWAFRPETETRDLGLLIGAVTVKPAVMAADQDDASVQAFELLTDVTFSENGRSFRLDNAVSGLALLDPREPGQIGFTILTEDPLAARHVQLYINGTPVPLAVAASGERRWRAFAEFASHLLSRRGYRTEWDLARAPEAAGSTVWIADFTVAGRPAIPDPALLMAATQPEGITNEASDDGHASPSASLSADPGFDNVRLHEHFLGDSAYAHLDLSIAGLTSATETWAKARFKFCSMKGRHYMEFRNLPGWPHVLTFGPDIPSDQFGAYLHVGDGKPLPAYATLRERALIRAIVAVLPTVVNAAIRQADKKSEALNLWADKAIASSRAWTDTLVPPAAANPFAAPQYNMVEDQR